MTFLKMWARGATPVLLCALAASGCAPLLQRGHKVDAAPQTILVRGETLVRTRTEIRAGNPLIAAAFRRLVSDADSALTTGPWSVTQKTHMPPSGDKHDYLSLAPYWWPDPAKPNGLPYIRRDGEMNPATRVDHDGLRFQAMVDAVEALALAGYFTGNAKYSRRAAYLLRVWFIDSATRMKPNLQFAQGIPGVSEGRGIGIIDLRHFPQLVDALGVLRLSSDWPVRDHRSVVAWSREYLRWLLTSKNGIEERAAENNHGTFTDSQLAALALFTGDSTLARQVFRDTRSRIDKQIKPDGSQPLELERTRPVHYSAFNLDAFTQVAELARHTGDDIWNYSSSAGGSLRAALVFMARFTDSVKKWDKPDVVPVGSEDFAVPLRRALLHFPDSALTSALRRLPIVPTASARQSLLYRPNASLSVFDSLTSAALVLAAQRLTAASTLDPAKGYPRFTETDGSWALRPAVQWTSGFFAGSLWYMYQLTGDSAWRSRAQRWTAGLERVKNIRTTHDLGFMIFDSFGHAGLLTGDSRMKEIVMTASASLASRYNPRIGAIKSWNVPATDTLRRTGWEYPVIVDNLMNLEMLFWAAENGGDPDWRRIAETHALTSSREHVRSDGSTFHVVLFDTTTGKKVRAVTWQGRADSSTWSRGQAWAIHGFAASYRRTRNPVLLQSAVRTADYFISRLPAGAVPYWDFHAPAGPGTPRDASAAAIAASGLLDLARFTDAASASRYRGAAERIISSLARSYTTKGTAMASVLMHSTGSFPHQSEVDVGLIYADYFFLESILRYKGIFLE